MLNDRSSILSLLETRRSGKPRELVGPGPAPDEMQRILTTAARVPDHGKLTPWRFVLIGDDQRGDLARLLGRASESPASSSSASRCAGSKSDRGRMSPTWPGGGNHRNFKLFRLNLPCNAVL